MPIITLDIAAAPAQRVSVALGKTLQLVDNNGNPRPATLAEYKDWVKDMTKRMVQGQEMKDAQEALQSPADLPIA